LFRAAATAARVPSCVIVRVPDDAQMTTTTTTLTTTMTRSTMPSTMTRHHATMTRDHAAMTRDHAAMTRHHAAMTRHHAAMTRRCGRDDDLDDARDRGAAPGEGDDASDPSGARSRCGGSSPGEQAPRARHPEPAGA
jgi:hypothetical protein